MPEALIREARLRPEHAGSYPDIEPGVWTPAAGLARLVLERHLYRQVEGQKGDRPLPESHFEFRGPSLPPEARPAGRSRLLYGYTVLRRDCPYSTQRRGACQLPRRLWPSRARVTYMRKL